MKVTLLTTQRGVEKGPESGISGHMATRTQVIHIDDLTGDPIPEGKGGRISFALEGVEYAIDLSDKNAKKLRQDLSTYISAATRVGTSNGRGRGRSARRTSPSSAKNIREWGRANGFEVPERGRIPIKVLEAFQAR
jgi:hypothetical protein